MGTSRESEGERKLIKAPANSLNHKLPILMFSTLKEKYMQQRSTLLVLLAALCVCSVQCSRPVIRAPRNAETTGRFIAVLKETTSHERFLEILELLKTPPYGCKILGYTETAVKAIVMELSEDALQKVRGISELKYIEEESVTYAAGTESDLNDTDPWHLDRIDQLNALLDYSYDPLPQQGEGVDVYILDTGIRFQHEEFGARAKYAGYDPVDNYECEQGTNDCVPQHGADCNGHGTAVASVVGGEMYGTARKANLYSVRVLRCDNSAPFSVILDGLDFIAEIIPQKSQIAVVLLPLAGSYSIVINDAIESLYNQGVVVITAAGNGGVDACLRSPASSPYAITVGATDRLDNITSTSNYGPCVDLFAPGEDILTASNQCDSCTEVTSGSTLSAGIMAGMAATYLSQLPHLTPAQIRDKILGQSITNIINFSTLSEDQQSQTPNILLNLKCGGKISVSHEQQGTLHSPGFPSNYPSNINCEWTLVAESANDSVHLNFKYIKLEKDYDKLSVGVEDDILTLTGDYGETDCELWFPGNCLTIQLSTDAFTESVGFTAIYAALPSTTEQDEEKTCSVDPPLVKTSIQLDVFSAGLLVGNRFSIDKDWNEVFAGRKRGINLAVFDEVTGSVLSTENFDTHASQQSSDQLAQAVENIRPGRIVCAAVSEEGTNHLNARAKRGINSLGSDKINQLTYKGSWALIGIKGAPCSNVIENSFHSSPVDLSAQVRLKPHHQYGIEIDAEIVAGNFAVVKVNDAVVDTPYTGQSHGLNVVIINEETGEVLHSQAFDMLSESTVDTSPESFVNLTMSQPEGRIVVVTVQEGISYISVAVAEAFESIGSALIEQVRDGDSWTIIGRKGAVIGSVPESSSRNGPCKSTFFLKLSNGNDVLCPVTVQSSGHTGIGMRISVNETQNNSPLRDGITLVTLHDSNCSVEGVRNFSSSDSNNLSEFIQLIPDGKTVLVSIAGDGVHNLNESARAALEDLGSAIIRNVGDREAWAAIGRKGAPRGSILEQSHPFSTAVAASVVLDTAVITAESAGFNVGNRAQFTFNANNIPILPNYGRGLNVIVFDSRRNVIKRQSFDTHSSPQQTQEFINLINSLPTGTVVAIAVRNTATGRLTDEAITAIEGLGSKYIRELEHRGSWALIGRKGAPQGTVLEAGRNTGPVKIRTYALPVSPITDDEECTIFVESAGGRTFGGIQFSVNGQEIGLPENRGIRIAVIEENCSSADISSYDTYIRSSEPSNELTEKINALPAGTVVVASIYDSASRSLQENAKKALESIGSARIRNVKHHDGWAIIGRKGASPGSVPEAHARRHNSRSAVAVGGIVKLKPDRVSVNELYPLDC